LVGTAASAGNAGLAVEAWYWAGPEVGYDEALACIADDRDHGCGCD